MITDHKKLTAEQFEAAVKKHFKELKRANEDVRAMARAILKGK